MFYNFPNSSAIKNFMYDEKSKDLEVTFNSGGTYNYPNVPMDIINNWTTSDSAGKYFHKFIKPYSINR